MLRLGRGRVLFRYPSFRSVPLLTLALLATTPLRLLRRSTRRAALRIPSIPRWGRLLDAGMAGGGMAASWMAVRGLFSAAEVARLVPTECRADALAVDAIENTELSLAPHDIAMARQVSFLEATRYMHDQLLRDCDCMSMAHALEVRPPLIGLPVIEAVSRISSTVLWGNGKKAVLASIAETLIPAVTVSGPKETFTLNFRDLMRAAWPPGGPPARFLRADATSAAWSGFERGTTGFAYPWSLVVLERALARLSA